LLHLVLIVFGPLLTPYSPTEFHSIPMSGEEAVAKATSDVDFRIYTESGRLPQSTNKQALVQFYQAHLGAVDQTGAYNADVSEARLNKLAQEWEEDQRVYIAGATGKLRTLEAPSVRFWFGTDNFGRDILSRVMTGATSLISVAAAGALLGITFGTVLGMSSGFKGGRTDEVVMRVMDGMMSFPSLLIALLVLTSLGPNPVNVVGTLGVVSVAPVSRVMRSVTLAVKNLEFVESARLRGEPTLYITFREILPNALPVLAVEASVRFSYAILLVASLGFLGLGAQPPSSDWGLMISESRRFIVAAPWVAVAPAVAVATLVIGVNLLADGIRQARDLPMGND